MPRVKVGYKLNEWAVLEAFGVTVIESEKYGGEPLWITDANLLVVPTPLTSADHEAIVCQVLGRSHVSA